MNRFSAGFLNASVPRCVVIGNGMNCVACVSLERQNQTCGDASLRTAVFLELERQHVQSQVCADVAASDESLPSGEERAYDSAADVEEVPGLDELLISVELADVTETAGCEWPQTERLHLVEMHEDTTI